MNPFRELFVEVAQNLLEAAAIEAQQRKTRPFVHHRPSVASSINEENIARLLCQHFGWSSASTWRAVRDRVTEFGVVMRCGHKHAFGIPDNIIEDAASSRLLEVVERAWRDSLSRRRCYCVDPGRLP